MPVDAYRILTGVVSRTVEIRNIDGIALRPSGWRAYLTVEPFGATGEEGEGEGETPRAALDRAMADLAEQGVFKEEEAA